MESAPEKPQANPLKALKASYYSDSKNVLDYEHKRFARGSGALVAQLESAAIRRLVQGAGATQGIALDCPCGTGRFIPLLRELGFEVIAADLSLPMLEASRRHDARNFLQGAADHLPLEAASVDLWLMSRFCFHFPDPLPFVREAGRVLRPGGLLLLDVYNWTPRQWLPGAQTFLGGRTATHRRGRVLQWAQEAGFEVEAEAPAFLLAPYLYGFFPLWLTRLLEKTSDRLAPRWKSKCYYLLRKKKA